MVTNTGAAGSFEHVVGGKAADEEHEQAVKGNLPAKDETHGEQNAAIGVEIGLAEGEACPLLDDAADDAGAAHGGASTVDNTATDAAHDAAIDGVEQQIVGERIGCNLGEIDDEEFGEEREKGSRNKGAEDKRPASQIFEADEEQR